MAKKDVGLRIRVDRDLRHEFLDVCRTQDKPASQVLREFMRGYIEGHRNAQQATLFGPESETGTR